MGPALGGVSFGRTRMFSVMTTTRDMNLVVVISMTSIITAMGLV